MSMLGEVCILLT